MGARSQSAVATLVDRRTRYLRLVPLPEGHSAGQLRDALIAALGKLPERARRSLTWDQGSEMSRHHELAPYFTDGIFFARPDSPWERGTNENTNGLIRQYLPKRTNLSLHTADDLRVIEQRLNNRPRKTLSWQTPSRCQWWTRLSDHEQIHTHEPAPAIHPEDRCFRLPQARPRA
ncbi:hypothetical protein AR457_00395 [Streptomyces agglomeratus]|uniref:Integrase catalytic domain-containing protein n=1 Tax=Streptomyces agglomeratus TaxID=285458 RepID=A0A1E5P108_9ACTN|nr:IS30 family transposase [Streptomyces agglomeratus]OEJ23238.1 hypothetical protein AS594_00625 [Streptomyces agglomeratus]OEJ42810.1 hypothetical protein AR457_00395 [Streptomyces agglomeratus]OEJ55257.1 hypothetical protein BGK72_35305 [Streptomyces agglomeratus]OEJ62626.1 hypothetical protein BGM19_36270 [Streptomyces agglomeratus]